MQNLQNRILQEKDGLAETSLDRLIDADSQSDKQASGLLQCAWRHHDNMVGEPKPKT